MLSESNKIRVSNVSRIAVVAMMILIGSRYFEVAGNILILKLLVVPMFWLSLLGLRALYKKPIEQQAVFSANVVEYNALYVLLLSSFILIVCWTPSIEFSQIIKGSVIALLVGLPLVCIYITRT